MVRTLDQYKNAYFDKLRSLDENNDHHSRMDFIYNELSKNESFLNQPVEIYEDEKTRRWNDLQLQIRSFLKYEIKRIPNDSFREYHRYLANTFYVQEFEKNLYRKAEQNCHQITENDLSEYEIDIHVGFDRCDEVYKAFGRKLHAGREFLTIQRMIVSEVFNPNENYPQDDPASKFFGGEETIFDLIHYVARREAYDKCFAKYGNKYVYIHTDGSLLLSEQERNIERVEVFKSASEKKEFSFSKLQSIYLDTGGELKEFYFENPEESTPEGFEDFLVFNQSKEAPQLANNQPKNHNFFKSHHEQVVNALDRFFEGKDKEAFAQLIIHGMTPPRKLIFNGKGNSLLAAFRKFYDNHILIVSTKEELEQWIGDNFKYTDKTGVKDFSAKYIHRFISENTHCKNPIIDITGTHPDITITLIPISSKNTL